VTTTALEERDRLLGLLRDRSFRTGDFVLSSGARSPYYIDARLTTMSGVGQMLIGRTGLALLDEAGWRPSAVGGLTLGADPVACAIAHAAALAGRTLDAFTVRKQPKGHGTARRIEGPLRDDASVVVVEDVVTTGESALRAIDAVSEIGARVIGVLALVDREQGGREKLLERGFTLKSAFRTTDLLAGAT
jgi:orotate phosphoribosyltransferase